MPKAKRVVQIALLLFVAGSVGFLVAKEYSAAKRAKAPQIIATQASAATEAVVDTKIKSDHIVTYYFHGDFRCANCMKIEAYSKEGVENNFANEIKNGILLFEVINVEEPENRHFIRDFNLHTKSVVVVSYGGDRQIRYKNLDKVWDHLGSKDQFIEYVKNEVSAFVSEVSK